MARTRTDLIAFTDWLTAIGHSDGTSTLYAHWVRRILRDVPIVTQEAITEYVASSVERRYRNTCRSAWRSMRAYMNTQGVEVPDFAPQRTPHYLRRSAGPLPIPPPDPLADELVVRTDVDSSVQEAVASLLAVTNLKPADVPLIVWKGIDLTYMTRPGYGLVPVPKGKKGDVAFARTADLRTLRAWGWDDDPPDDGPLVPATPKSYVPAPVTFIQSCARRT